MRVDHTDIADARHSILRIRDDIIDRLESALEYLRDREDFTLQEPFEATLNDVCSGVMGYAGLYMHVQWVDALNEVILGADDNVEPTVDHVRLALLEMLVLHTVQPQPNNLMAQAYTSMVTNHFAHVASTYPSVDTARAEIREICDIVGPRDRNISGEAAYALIREGDNELAKAVAAVSKQRMEERTPVNTERMLQVLAATPAALGLAPPVEDTERRVPRYPAEPRDFGKREAKG